MRTNSKAKILFLLLIAFAIISCDDDSSGPSSGGTTDLNIEGKYEVSYNENTNVIPAGNFISLDTNANIVTISADGVETPEVGSVILVEGEVLKKVKSATRNGNQIVIEAEDANLTDAIENGTIELDLTPTWDEVEIVKIDDKEVNIKQGLGNEIQVEREIEMGDYKYKITVTPSSEGGEIRSATFKFDVAKSVGGKYTASFNAEGTVKLPKQKSRIEIADGELENFKTVNEGITSDIKLSVAVAGGTGGETSLELPGVALSIPIRYIPTPSGPIPNPIPMTIDVGVQFVTKLTIPTANASATLQTELSIDSNTGIEYKGTTVDTEAKVNDENIGSGSFDSAAGIGIPVDAQFGVAFPRVSLNILGQEVAFVHLGFTSGSSLEWGPVCKRGYAKLLVQGGYQLSILGREILSEDKIFYENEKRADCE